MILCKVENNKVDCVYEVIRVYYRKEVKGGEKGGNLHFALAAVLKDKIFH